MVSFQFHEPRLADLSLYKKPLLSFLQDEFYRGVDFQLVLMCGRSFPKITFLSNLIKWAKTRYLGAFRGYLYN